MTNPDSSLIKLQFINKMKDTKKGVRGTVVGVRWGGCIDARRLLLVNN